MFHNILYSDGTAYDSRENSDDQKTTASLLQEKNSIPDWKSPNAGITKRAWQWMATGPLKGRAAQTLYLGTTQLPGYNAVSLKLSYRDWVTDSTAFSTIWKSN